MQTSHQADDVNVQKKKKKKHVKETVGRNNGIYLKRNSLNLQITAL